MSGRVARVVFLGPPGAGKGTQAKALEDRLALRQISTGDILRRNVAEGTELGRQAKPYMEAGGLVPDALIVGMMEPELARNDSFLLDGFPRTVAQAVALDAALQSLGKPLTAVVLIDASREQLVKRLTGRWTNPRTGRTYHSEFNPPKVPGVDDIDGGPLEQRFDDTAELVSERLATYDAKTAPLIDYYRRTGLLVTIDGFKPIAEVSADVLRAIAAKSGQAA
jgi:adenylate kinase